MRSKRADPEERKLVETVLTDGNYDQVPFSKILVLLERPAGSSVRRSARKPSPKRRAIIGEFPESPYQRALMAVTESGYQARSLRDVKIQF